MSSSWLSSCPRVPRERYNYHLNREVNPIYSLVECHQQFRVNDIIRSLCSCALVWREMLWISSNEVFKPGMTELGSPTWLRSISRWHGYAQSSS